MRTKRTKFNGTVLQSDIFDSCYYALRSYPFLQKVQVNLCEIDVYGYRQSFIDKIHEKVDIEKQIAVMDEAFATVPDKYIDAVKYCLFTKDSKAVQQDMVVYTYGVDYAEVCVWLDKLIYQYAVLSGWPVPQRVEEITLLIYEDGTIELG